MKRTTKCITILLVILFATPIVLAQNIPIDKANYKLAERFSPNKMKKMVFTTSVDPHWLKLSERFWYTYETPDGKTFYIVDPVRKRAAARKMTANTRNSSPWIAPCCRASPPATRPTRTAAWQPRARLARKRVRIAGGISVPTHVFQAGPPAIPVPQ